MQSDGQGEARPAIGAAATAPSFAQTARYRAAYDELRTIHQELVAETARLAARIEERLSPRLSE